MSGQYPSYPGDEPEGQGGSTPPPPPYGQPAPGQPYPGQQYPGQPYPGQPPAGQHGVPPGHPGHDPYAHWGLRFAGYLLDSLISSAVFIPLYAVGYGFLIADTNFSTGSVEGGPLTVVGVVLSMLSVLVVIAFTFWNLGVRQGRSGQSLGKQIVSIKVVKEDGTTLGTWLSVGRTLLFSLLTTCTCYINALWPLWDPKKQALHDKVVNTVVLKA
ncbi:RDD family protein [Aeromicrobium sp. CF4.19]|uniref:RDD family protein n=1 Tax=Aeromicrobium sp. CF4.19 TaxID=3373082 RepID=UPI003EE61D6C